MKSGSLCFGGSGYQTTGMIVIIVFGHFPLCRLTLITTREFFKHAWEAELKSGKTKSKNKLPRGRVRVNANKGHFIISNVIVFVRNVIMDYDYFYSNQLRL